MKETIIWSEETVTCPEEGRSAHLLVEWKDEDGDLKLKGVCCDNPKFGSLENHSCEGSCWEVLSPSE
ncbi:MAG TPA: hypothetical protein PK014_00555 [Thermoanaerobaculia bacterium]|nr:hypothetical protein [Thermoanaerobaculia bacterium]HXK66962.1 hypothetical protein [Thermoanaerobaculia bacterium]